MPIEGLVYLLYNILNLKKVQLDMTRVKAKCLFVTPQYHTQTIIGR